MFNVKNTEPRYEMCITASPTYDDLGNITCTVTNVFGAHKEKFYTLVYEFLSSLAEHCIDIPNDLVYNDELEVDLGIVELYCPELEELAEKECPKDFDVAQYLYNILTEYLPKDSNGALLSTITSVELYKVDNDGYILTYDYDDQEFVSVAKFI